MVHLQLWQMGKKTTSPYQNWTQELPGAYMYASTLKGHPFCHSLTKSLNWLEVAVFLD